MFNVAQSKKFVEKELTKFQKLNYNQFRWWRWYESRNKPLPNKADFRDKIFNGYLNFPENAAVKQVCVDAQQKNDQTAFQEAVNKFQPQLDSIFQKTEKFRYSPEQIKAYETIGGSPHLDGEYTVFGEVVEGLEVIDKIAALSVDQRNRPQRDVKMYMEIVKK